MQQVVRPSMMRMSDAAAHCAEGGCGDYLSKSQSSTPLELDVRRYHEATIQTQSTTVSSLPISRLLRRC